jgi:hypothetical protein
MESRAAMTVTGLGVVASATLLIPASALWTRIHPTARTQKAPAAIESGSKRLAALDFGRDSDARDGTAGGVSPVVI